MIHTENLLIKITCGNNHNNYTQATELEHERTSRDLFHEDLEDTVLTDWAQVSHNVPVTESTMQCNFFVQWLHIPSYSKEHSSDDLCPGKHISKKQPQLHTLILCTKLKKARLHRKKLCSATQATVAAHNRILYQRKTTDICQQRTLETSQGSPWQRYAVGCQDLAHYTHCRTCPCPTTHDCLSRPTRTRTT